MKINDFDYCTWSLAVCVYLTGQNNNFLIMLTKLRDNYSKEIQWSKIDGHSVCGTFNIVTLPVPF